MNRGRKSFLVIMARILQSVPPILLNWIELYLKKYNIKKYPIIFIISAPRSGSTLTYQILSKGIRCQYFTNLWNLLYSVPLIGGLFSMDKMSSKNDFSSDRGLVDGVYGQAEGLKFWKYWIDQGLEQKRKNNIRISRIKYLRKVFGRLLSEKSPLIISFLGHAYCVDLLRIIFPGCIFLYLKRDKLSNIYSMYKVGQEFEWFSLKSYGWKEALKLDSHSRYIWQYNKILKTIESQISHEDTLVVNYEKICQDPKGFLKDVKLFCRTKNIEIKLTLENIPDSFEVSKVTEDDNSDAKLISDILNG